jgi:hypothetical protein
MSIRKTRGPSRRTVLKGVAAGAAAGCSSRRAVNDHGARVADPRGAELRWNTNIFTAMQRLIAVAACEE